MNEPQAGLADLHVHTTASDGVLDVAGVLARARRAGLRAVSITDHDTSAAYLRELPPANGVAIVPGIELSCDTPWGELHVLGYHLDVRHAPLLERLEKLRQNRVRRLDRMLELLAGAGVRFTDSFVEDLRTRPGSIGRPHVARQMVKMAVVPSFRDAFERYLAEGRPAYVPHRNGLNPEDAVWLILDAGGCPVVAHPARILEKAPADFLPKLCEMGLRGIEVSHPSHNSEHVSTCRKLARELGLLETGGSDFHSDEDLDGQPSTGRHCGIGGCTAPYAVIEQLQARKGRSGRCAGA